MKQPGKMIVWVANVDRSKTRHQGRRISKSLSVDSPRLSEMENAAKSASLAPLAKTGSARPGTWWDKTGYVVVDRGNLSRTEILKTIAKHMTKEKQSKKA
ncbi:signal recognition particle protein Srp19 [Candidatus Bathyarchaeota archaeon]|nr:signal recognition particle protein Srp19 [Candidatus Bathyarchaeota archaeon]